MFTRRNIRTSSSRGLLAVTALSCVALAGITSNEAAGQCAEEVQKLLASDGAAGDEFGTVRLQGDRFVVGALSAGIGGAAYVFREQGGVWIEEQKLIGSDIGSGDWFGRTLSIDGELIVVGANLHNDAGSDSGAAYVFHEAGGVWTEEAKLVASDAASGDWFGNSVSVDGDVILVGSPFDGSSGSAYIFRYNGAVWNEEQKLTGSNAVAGALFGARVWLDGEVALVGAYSGSSPGFAYVFRFNGVEWVEEQKLAASDGASGDYFGITVFVSGDDAAISASGDDADSGSAYIFRYDGDAWNEEAKLTASDGAAGDRFGDWVRISGDTVIASSTFHDGVGSNSGAAYLFRYDEASASWSEIEKITASDASSGDEFGHCAIDQDRVVFGSHLDDDNGSGSGSVYVFDISECLPSQDLILQYHGNGWVELPDGVTPTENVTIEMWARADETLGEEAHRMYFWGPRIGCNPSSQTLAAVDAEWARPGFRTHLWAGCAHASALNGLDETQAGVWQHTAVTIQGNGFGTLYINGFEQESGFYRGGQSVGDGNDLLGAWWSGNDFFKSSAGALDEVRVWDHVRTQKEIQETMDETLTGNEDGLIALWNFDDGTANDVTPNGNDGVLFGDAEIVPKGEAIPATLLSFNVAGGNLIAGDLQSLEESDDDYVQIDAQLSNLGAAYVSRTLVRAKSPATTVSRLDLTLETGVDAELVTTRVFLRNFDTGDWDLLEGFTQSESDSQAMILDVPNPNAYVRDDHGQIAVQIETRANAAQVPGGYVFRIDHVQLAVTTGEGGGIAGGGDNELPCDLDGDAVVGASDLVILLGAWETNPGGPPDFNGDGVVNAIDLIELLGNWGPCPK